MFMFFKFVKRNEICSPYTRNKKYFSTIDKTNFLQSLMKLNRYGGAVIDLENNLLKLDSNSSNNYDQMIKKVVIDYKNKNINSITISIHSKYSFLIQYFIDNSFYFHHANKDKVVLCLWLNENKENKIPNYPHHSIGIGAIIFNKDLEFLLVKEKHNQLPGRSLWKYVTGHVELAENINIATLREIKEEVGLEKLRNLGNYSIREVYPLNNVNDICFFNLCYYYGEKTDLKIDRNELKDAKFHSIENFEDLCKSNNVTAITNILFEKFKSDLIEYKEFENTINKLEEIKTDRFVEYLQKHKVHKNHVYSGKDSIFDYFHYYL